MLIFRQMYDAQSSTYTYLLADSLTKRCVIIDPVFEQVRRDASFVRELGLEPVFILDTHVHADHVTGSWLLKQRLGGRIALSRASAAEGADRYLGHGDRIEFGGHALTVRATPGHTVGCLTYVMDDKSRAFTGDALLVRGCGRTDFQGGSASGLYHSIREQIFSLPDDCLLCPAHDYRGATATSVAEEKAYNPRIGGERGESDFTGYMANLNLPHPKQIDIAVPANMRCGRPQDGAVPQDPDWAPLSLTFAGIWEISPAWLEEHGSEVQIVDVRETGEFAGALGHIQGARLMPLGELARRSGELSKETPIVTVCRAGGRSAQATVLLQKAGFERVASLGGGMLRWQAGQHPVIGGFDYDSGL